MPYVYVILLNIVPCSLPAYFSFRMNSPLAWVARGSTWRRCLNLTLPASILGAHSGRSKARAWGIFLSPKFTSLMDCTELMTYLRLLIKYYNRWNRVIFYPSKFNTDVKSCM